MLESNIVREWKDKAKSSAIEEECCFQHCTCWHLFSSSKLKTIVVSLDGEVDSFAKKFDAFVKGILNNVNEQGGEKVQKELQEYFPKLSEQGSGDDLNLAGIFEIEKKYKRQ